MKNFYVTSIKNAFQNIDFVNRFVKVMTHTDFDNRLTKIDKKEILNILNGMGYSFKVINPGRDFCFEEKKGEIKFVFSFNVNGGIILSYIYVFVNDEKVPYDYPSLVFSYKYLINDLELLMNPSTVFTSYLEFKEIITDLLNIYEDFKREYLNEVSQATS